MEFHHLYSAYATIANEQTGDVVDLVHIYNLMGSPPEFEDVLARYWDDGSIELGRIISDTVVPSRTFIVKGSHVNCIIKLKGYIREIPVPKPEE